MMHPQSSPEELLSYRESTDKREEHGFAKSTVEATLWLICHEPKRLPAWLVPQPNDAGLEKVVREAIKDRVKKQREAASSALGAVPDIPSHAQNGARPSMHAGNGLNGSLPYGGGQP
jgi:hypothetical protein